MPVWVPPCDPILPLSFQGLWKRFLQTCRKARIRWGGALGSICKLVYLGGRSVIAIAAEQSCQHYRPVKEHSRQCSFGS